MDKKRLDLSVIIVSYNTRDLTRDCVRSVTKFTKKITYEILVVDNGSKDDSVKTLKELSKVSPLTLIENSVNRGFGGANNQGMKKASGRYLLLLNSDTAIDSNVLGEMVTWMDKNPKVGVSTCALKNKDGSLQGTGGYFPTLLRVIAWMFFWDDIPLISQLIKPFHPMHSRSPFYKGNEFFIKPHQVDWVTGAFLFFRGELLENVGYFDDDYFMYVEETDYAYRAKKQGWQVWFLPQWSITHYGGASGTGDLAVLSEFKGIKTFYKKHMPSWQMPLLKFCLKAGSLLRIIFFGKTYAKAYKEI